MRRKIDWESQIGRRLKLRDLHVFSTVVQRGSMAKAAAHLGVSTATVSEVIADLEDTLGLKLLDRNPRGVEPNLYGRALRNRCTAAFDELKQSVRDLEFLASRDTGEVRIGCPESSTAMLSSVMERFWRQYPRVTFSVEQVGTYTLEVPGLRERKVDLVVGRLSTPMDVGLADELNIEVLFHDQLVVVTGAHSRFARRRKIDLAELVDEPWILAEPGGWTDQILAIFRARGLNMPKMRLATFFMHLRTNMLASGQFITTFPRSTVRFDVDRSMLKVLPVELPIPPWPCAIVTLKNRTLSPAVERFIEHLRDFTRPMRPRTRAVE
jgi:DNA-binding transcriptional LysR family regulator